MRATRRSLIRGLGAVALLAAVWLRAKPSTSDELPERVQPIFSELPETHNDFSLPMAITFNAYGCRGDLNCPNPNLAINAANNSVGTRLMARASNLLTVGLQEVCRNQAAGAYLILASSGLPFSYSFRKTTALPAPPPGEGERQGCENREFGIATIVAGNKTDGSVLNYANSDRGAVCVRNDAPTPFWGCTTHLSTDPSTAYFQAFNYKNYVIDLPGTAEVASGDFNLEPTFQGLAGPWYDNWVNQNPTFGDADAGRQRDTQGPVAPCSEGSADSRIDYLFGRNVDGGWSHDPFITCFESLNSDHFWVQGYR